MIYNLFVSVILYLTCAKEKIIKRFQILPGYVAYGITANASLCSWLVYNGCTEFGISNRDSTLLNMHWQHLFVISYSGSLRMHYVHSCLNLADLIISFCFLATAAESSTLTSGVQLMVTLFMAYSYHFSLTIINWIDVGCWEDFSKN